LRSKSGWDVQVLPPVEVIRSHELVNGTYPMLITLSHYPMAEWEAKHYHAWLLHSHSHGCHKGEGFLLDVGVDANYYAPISLAHIKGNMASLGWKG
jgi:calcineurin-like phosphoesterase family protein